jgi:hypothetical protein
MANAETQNPNDLKKSESTEEEIMAKQIMKGLTMSLLIAIALVTAVNSANGQASRRLVANIPFEFQVGDTSLAAGEYDVRAMTPMGETLRIRNTENQGSAMRLSNAVTQLNINEKGKLVFHRYGNQYFLAEVWTPGERTGRKLTKSTGEKAVEREIAAIPSKTAPHERIELALVRQ